MRGTFIPTIIRIYKYNREGVISGITQDYFTGDSKEKKDRKINIGKIQKYKDSVVFTTRNKYPKEPITKYTIYISTNENK